MLVDEYLRDVARRMPESELQDNVVGAARSLGYICFHTFDSRKSEPGFPDLVLVHPRRLELPVICAELKTQRGKLSDAQRLWVRALDERQTLGRVFRAADWMDDRITAVLQGDRSAYGNPPAERE